MISMKLQRTSPTPSQQATDNNAGVLHGALAPFMEAYLRWKAAQPQSHA